MRSIFYFLLVTTGLGFLLTACDKADNLPYYTKGNAPSLSSSTTVIAASSADSDKVVLSLGWTAPNYATDPGNIKYVVQIDSMGGNFSKAVSKTVVGQMGTTFTAKELNNILLGFGFAFGVPYYVDVRVISSYVNNNEPNISNTITIKMTPYKIPPKVAPPASGKLFIVGDATAGGWNNPVPTPTQEFSKLDSTTYAGVFQLTGGKQYLLLPVNGDWSKKYALKDNSVPGIDQGGDFGYHQDGQPAPDVYQSNFIGPAASGLYKIVVDFQTGKFTVTPYTAQLPTNLYIVGDATAGGWNNPVPVPSQQFTQLNSSEFEITLPVNGGKQYLLLPSNGDWSMKYALKDNSVPGIASGGEFGYHQDGQPAPDLYQANFVAPNANGTYTIHVNFAGGTTPGTAGSFWVK
ncbi:MAG: SusE domain-containing protein [Flavisolibacter sp.]